MTLGQYVGIARRWWALLVGLGVLGASAGYGLSVLLPARYESTTTLLVIQRQEPGVFQLNDLQASERLASTFSRLAVLDPVLEAASATLGGSPSAADLERRVSVANPAGTQLLEVTAWDSDATRASLIADAVASVFIASTEEGIAGQQGLVSVVEPAKPARAASWPRVPLNVAFGLVGGLVVGLGVAMLAELSDDSVRTPAQVVRAAGLRTLGRVPRFGRAEAGRDALQVVLAPASRVAEAYRGVRTTLTYELGLSGRGRSVLFTAARSDAGTSTTVANLAVALGMSGRRVVVVDADLRAPSQATIFGTTAGVGLSMLLQAREDVEVARATPATVQPNVFVLPAGAPVSNPSELLGSARMVRVLDQLRERFDIVLFDTPPALEATDAAVLAELVDGCVIVVRSGRTRARELAATVDVLGRAGRPIAGAILNRARGRELATEDYPVADYARDPLRAIEVSASEQASHRD